jgi:hypothetical protein
MKNTQKGFAILSLIIAFVMLLGVFGYIVHRSNTQLQQSSSGTDGIKSTGSLNQDQTEKLQTFRDENYGIEFKYLDTVLIPIIDFIPDNNLYECQTGKNETTVGTPEELKKLFSITDISKCKPPTNNIDNVVRAAVEHKLKPFGDNPKVSKLKIAGQEARLIESSNVAPSAEFDAEIIVTYPKSISVGKDKIAFLVIYYFKTSVNQILSTFKFTGPGTSEQINTASPLSDKVSNIKLGKVTINMKEIIDLQKSVDEGHQSWRMDPENVATVAIYPDGLATGADSSHILKRLSFDSQKGIAVYALAYQGREYKVTTVQPIIGKWKIWVVSDVEYADSKL